MNIIKFFIAISLLLGVTSCSSIPIKAVQKQNSLMLQAASNGNLKLLKESLNAGVSINAKDKYNNTALILAAKNRQSEIVRFLIENNADLDFFNDKDQCELQLQRDYYKSLFKQMLSEDSSRMNLLSTNKLDYYQESAEHGKTALIYAVQNNDLQSALLLIKAQADLDLSDKDHKTALMYAVLNQNFTLVQALLEANADLSIKAKIKPSFLTADSALTYAVFLKHDELTLLILSKMKSGTNAFNYDKANALNIASYKNYSYLLNVLIQDYKNNPSEIVLKAIKKAFIVACKKKNEKAVEIILANKVLDKETLEPGLFAACESGALALVKMILKSGATVFAKNKKGQSPLMVAARFGHLELVKLLVKKGSKVNQKDNYYDTALDLTKSIAVIKYLLSVGAKRGVKPKGYRRSFGEKLVKVLGVAAKVLLVVVFVAGAIVAGSDDDESSSSQHRRRRRKSDKEKRKAKKDAYHKKYGPSYQ